MHKTKEDINKLIETIKNDLQNSIRPYILNNVNSDLIKQLKNELSSEQEYKIKTYKKGKDITLKVYPVGNLKRLAEKKAQEVIMNGKKITLAPMGAFERFVIHDYLTSRNGIKTQSFGKEGKDRHIKIYPLFGREPKKAKKKLTI